VPGILRKVSPGDPLVIPAGAYNTFVDAARDYLDRRQDQAQTAKPAMRNSGIVLVRNDLNPPRPRPSSRSPSRPTSRRSMRSATSARSGASEKGDFDELACDVNSAQVPV